MMIITIMTTTLNSTSTEFYTFLSHIHLCALISFAQLHMVESLVALFHTPQLANARPVSRIPPSTLFSPPRTLFLPRGSAELSPSC